MVLLNISSIQVHVLSQAASVNLVPLYMTRFSRQLVPDRASCSLSVKKHILTLRKHAHAIYRGFKVVKKRTFSVELF